MRSKFVEDILNQINLEKLITQETTLRNGKALCPFHDDHNPSLHYYPDTQSFYCFGCGVGGTAIDWIMHRDNVDVSEAR